MRLRRCGILVFAVGLVSACGGAGGGGSTPSTCNDTCSTTGKTQCSGSHVQTCQANANGCLTWSALAACPTGQACVAASNTCAAVCNDACSSQGATQCSGLLVQTCTADANGCLAWSAAAACPTSLSCNASQNKCIDHLVGLAWAPNRESGVNRAGGGYQIAISSQPDINVPFVSGPSAPTSTAVRLPPGIYTVTVRAYAALDAQGGSAGTVSASSQSLTVSVPF
jgi:hypothetical protein